MALDRQSSGDGSTMVTFRLPAASGAARAQLLGDFNDWTPAPMERAADGGHELTLALEPGRSYRFRYLLDSDRWENDWQADDYVANEYGGDDSVIDLTSDSSTRPDKQTARPPTRQRATSTRKPATSRTSAGRT